MMLVLTFDDRGHKLMGMMPNFILSRPYVPEHDFSGTVVDSKDSKDFKLGDEVFGWNEFGMFDVCSLRPRTAIDRLSLQVVNA
jgi:NADPH:quinone reductase-like Zn-dependent oxidoreductase